MLKLLIPIAIAALFMHQLAEAQEPGAGVDVDAQRHHPMSIDERETRQRQAIRRGVESGELTRGEADRLRHEQARIERHELMARSDGRFTPRERSRIQHELDRSARHIRHETHDRQRAGGRDRPRHDHAQRVAHRGGGHRR
jgi:hypothetical protein